MAGLCVAWVPAFHQHARRVRAAVKGCKCVHVSTRLCVCGTLMQRSTDNTHPFHIPYHHIPPHGEGRVWRDGLRLDSVS